MTAHRRLLTFPIHSFVARVALKTCLALLTCVTITGCGGPETVPDGQAASAETDSGDAKTGDSNAAISLPDADAPGSGSKTGSGSKPPSDAIQLPDEIAPADSTETEPASKGGAFELPDVDQSSKTAAPVELKYATWNAIRERARSTGKVTVVDLWSTMCAPCIKEFPGLVRIDESLREKVTCIGVDLDFDGRKKYPPESYEKTVQAFLTSVNAQFDNYICQTPSDDVFKEVGVPSIPAVLVFNAEGELVKQFIDAGETLGFTYEKDVIPLVNSIL